MRSRLAPVAGVRVGKGCASPDFGRDKHSFIAREHRLAERNDRASFVDDSDVGLGWHTVGFIGERLRDLTVVVTEQPTVLLMSAHSYPLEQLLTIDFGYE